MITSIGPHPGLAPLGLPSPAGRRGEGGEGSSLMMLEHEVAHCAQADAYAGLEGWPVPHIFGRAFEDVMALQPQERRRHDRLKHG